MRDAVARPDGPSSAASSPDSYWQLGVGYFYTGLGSLTELDVARFDWIVLCFGSIPADRETTEQLNRFLKINPNLKVVVRLWPTSGIGDSPENNYTATFLHYLYLPGVKEKLHANIRQQIHALLDHIDKPENVVGFTFLEEVPGHFSSSPFTRPVDAGLAWDLVRFQKEIEAERGEELRWNVETRLWWGRKWVEALDGIHAEIKKEADDRLVFYWLQTNHRTLDDLRPGESFEKPLVVPHRWADIVKPGLCDGFFAYPNSEEIWTKRYLSLAKANGWPFFSQVSHPSFMRLCPWETNVSLAKTKLPQNLGYFFFCSGDCAAGYAWNEDRSLPTAAAWHVAEYSQKLHVRRHLAEQDVGMDILMRQPPLQLHVELPLDGALPGQPLRGVVVVENAREPSFFLDPNEAVAREVTVTINVPGRMPTRRPIGDLEPGELRTTHWWMNAPENFSGRLGAPVKIVGEASGCASTVVEVRDDATVSYGESHDVSGGERWIEATYRTAGQPSISLEALLDGVSEPRVAHENESLAYRGRLRQGERVVFDAAGGARLLTAPVLDDDGSVRKSIDDPTGFSPFTKGYVVSGVLVRRQVSVGQSLRVSVQGQISGSVQSQLMLRYRLEDGTTSDQVLLVNRFSEEWSSVSETVPVPERATSLQRVYLYRRGDPGQVWYGTLKVERADVPAKGRDVSDRILGRFPRVSSGRIHRFRYTDDADPFTGPRARVQLVWEK